jgi:hypothetical protein
MLDVVECVAVLIGAADAGSRCSAPVASPTALR